MSSEMKLLTALCEALGFEVVRDVDYQERQENMENAMRYNMGFPKGMHMRRRLISDGMGALVVDENGFYTSYLVDPIVSYSLVKKEAP